MFGNEDKILDKLIKHSQRLEDKILDKLIKHSQRLDQLERKLIGWQEITSQYEKELNSNLVTKARDLDKLNNRQSAKIALLEKKVALLLEHLNMRYVLKHSEPETDKLVRVDK